MQLPQRLSWCVDVRGDGVHLVVAGELDHRTSDEFDLAVRGLLTGRPEALVFDLTAVGSVSAEGTAALVDAVHRAAQICASVVILPSRAVRHRLELLGLSEALLLGDGDAPPGHAPPAESA